MGKLKDCCFQAFSFFLEGTRDEIRKREDEAGLDKMVAALYDANIKDETILNLLQKYYQINRNEGQEILRVEKIIAHPCRKLEEYLMNKELMSKEEAIDFIKRNNVEQMLYQNKTLCKLSTEDLFDEIEKNRNK